MLRIFVALAAAVVVFYAARFWTVLAAGELFHRLGFDWSLFYAQALAVRDGVGAAMYDPITIAGYLERLRQYYSGPAPALNGWPQPYPPWFAAAMLPLTVLPAPAAFLVWIGLSLAASVFLAYRVSQLLPELGMIGALLAILASVPVAWGLFLGQPAVLLAIPVGEMFLSLRARKDMRAGLWLSLLFLKPQYALLFGIFLLWKRRWLAVVGASLGGIALVALGVLTTGIESLWRFISVIQSMSDLRNEIAGPTLMMNWRGVVLWMRPDIDERTGLIIVWALSLATMLLCLLVWRGAWAPESESFGPKFAVLSVGALVGSYHNHPHGAALLIVPLAAGWASPLLSRTTRLALWLAIYVPTFIVVWVTGVVDRLSVSPNPDIPLWTVWPNALPGVLFLLALGLLWRNAIPPRLAWSRPSTRSYA